MFSDGYGDLEESSPEILLRVKSDLAQDIMQMCAEAIATEDDECSEQQSIKDNIIIDAMSTALVYQLVAYSIRNGLRNKEAAMAAVTSALSSAYDRIYDIENVKMN